jgi:hypothetical protein
MWLLSLIREFPPIAKTVRRDIISPNIQITKPPLTLPLSLERLFHNWGKAKESVKRNRQADEKL